MTTSCTENMTTNSKMTEDQDSSMEGLDALYAKTLYVLRESRKSLLKQYEVDDETALMEKIRCGGAGEHPAYEHYLSALIIEQTRQHLREEMMARFRGANAADVPSLSVHVMLKEHLEASYAGRMTEPARLAQDALLLAFDTGLMMEVRYFSANEYAVHWSWGDAVLRIDTAPVHKDRANFPQHLHRDDGSVAEDVLTSPGADPWVNFSRLLEVLLVDPLLEETGSC